MPSKRISAAVATRAAAASAVVGALIAGGLVTTEHESITGDHFGYQVAGQLTTTNAGSDVGSSQFAQTLSARLYPGVFVPGPSGQDIPNTDLVQAQVLPGAQRIVQYQLAPEAVFSDGVPVSCTDYLLTFTAGTNPSIFGSHMPLFDDVESVNCEPGAKNFDVVFKQGAGARWRQLFSPGTVLPSHAIASRLNTDETGLNADLQSDDPELLRPIAEVWHDGFDLANFDPELQVSFGPYKIDEVGEQGEVTLVENPSYYGDAPLTPEIVVWPGEADSAQLNDQGNLRIAELSEPNPAWLDINSESNNFTVSTVVGALTDSLTFAPAGEWADAEKRRAISTCIDQRAVAEASSSQAGEEVPATATHVVSYNDPMARRLADITDPHLDSDTSGDKAASGMELRIGYAPPSPRMAAMVESIRTTCEPAGITVTDATGEGKTLRDLTHTEVGDDGEETLVTGTIDAMLRPVDPMTEYTAPSTRQQDPDAVRDAEKKLWDELPSIPLAAAPRSFAVGKDLGNVVVYTGPSGIGWNMDRWMLEDASAPDPTPLN